MYVSVWLAFIIYLWKVWEIKSVQAFDQMQDYFSNFPLRLELWMFLFAPQCLSLHSTLACCTEKCHVSQAVRGWRKDEQRREVTSTHLGDVSLGYFVRLLLRFGSGTRKVCEFRAKALDGSVVVKGGENQKMQPLHFSEKSQTPCLRTNFDQTFVCLCTAFQCSAFKLSFKF